MTLPDPHFFSPSVRVVIIFIIVKIFFYVCWYRSRQRQLAAYLSNPRNAQIVIVGGRAYLHQMCERQSVSDTLTDKTPNRFATTWQNDLRPACERRSSGKPVVLMVDTLDALA